MPPAVWIFLSFLQHLFFPVHSWPPTIWRKKMSRLTNNLTVYMTRVRPRRISCDEGVRTTPSFSNACDSQPAELMRPLGSVDQCGCLWLIIYDSFLKSDVTVHDFWFVELTAVSSECNGRKTSLRSWQTLERSCSSADNTKSCICFLGTNGSFVLCKHALKLVSKRSCVGT